MRALTTPDLHLSEKPPDKRCDVYWKTSLNKFEFILKTAKENEVAVILQPGDFTDSSNMSWEFFIKLAELINLYKILIVTIHGQHSLRYRTNGNTALDALQEACAGYLRILSYTDFLPVRDTYIFGSGYGEEIPKVDSYKGTFNILLTHRMIISEKKIWEGQEEFTWAKNFLRKNDKFDLIVSGDNHAQFEDNLREERFLFNCGTLMRNTISLSEYKPYLILFDTKKLTKKRIFVPIEPFKKVFDTQKIKQEENRDEEIDAFVEGIKNYKDMGLNFKNNIINYIRKNEVNSDILNVFRDFFKSVDGKDWLNERSAKRASRIVRANRRI
jgi:hypothetical protein